MKNLAIAGGMLALAAFGAGAWSWDERRRASPRCASRGRKRASPTSSRYPETTAPRAAALGSQRAGRWRLTARRYSRAMNAVLKVLSLLPWPDWVALVAFFAAWVGYALFARAAPSRSLRCWPRPTACAASGCCRRPTARCASSTASSSRTCRPALVLRLDDDPDHRRPARGARHHRQGERAGARDPVRDAHVGAGVRPEAAAAAGHLRLRVLPLHLVDAAVHLRRAARRGRAGGGALRASDGVARSASPTGPAASSAWPPRHSTTAARLLLRVRRDRLVLLAARLRDRRPRASCCILYQREFRSECWACCARTAVT